MWDVASHQPLHHLPAADHDNRTLAITPDGRWLLTGSADQTVYRYDLQSAVEPQRWQAHTDRVESLAISSDGHRLLSATDSGALLLWDVDTGTTIARWSLHSAAVDALALDPTGKTALVAAADGTLSAWDVRGSGEVGRFGKHPASVLDVAWLPDGRHFIASIGRITGDAPLAADNAPRLWDSATGRIVRTFDGHTDAVFQMVVQGNRLITTSYDQTVRIWDVATGEEIGRIWANSILTAVAANADTIVTGGLDGSLIAWDATQTRHLQTFAASATWPVWDVAISADGTRLLAASDDGIRLWDVETGERLAHWQDHSETVTAVIFAPDGRTAFSSGNESAILRWDVATGAVLQRYDGHGGIRTRLAVSSDGTRLYSSGWDGKLIVRDVTTGEVLQTLSGHATTFIMDLAIQDGRLLTAGADGSAIVWEEVVSADWLQWVSQHRYVRDLRCDEWETFQIGDQSNGCADPID
jgi:WD40 repeat protein